MDVVLCKDCEFFVTNMNERANLATSDFHCGNTNGLVNPGPNDFCSRGVRAKKSGGIDFDGALLEKVYNQRKGF